MGRLSSCRGALSVALLALALVPARSDAAPTQKVGISGEAEVAQTLTAVPGVYSPPGIGTPRYEWYVCLEEECTTGGQEIAEGNSYTVSPVYAGRRLYVQEIYGLLADVSISEPTDAVRPIQTPDLVPDPVIAAAESGRAPLCPEDAAPARGVAILADPCGPAVYEEDLQSPTADPAGQVESAGDQSDLQEFAANPLGSAQARAAADSPHLADEVYKIYANPTRARPAPGGDAESAARAGERVGPQNEPGIPLRYGNLGWGYRHIKNKHGFTKALDKAIPKALFDPNGRCVRQAEPAADLRYRCNWEGFISGRGYCGVRVIVNLRRIRFDGGRGGIVTAFFTFCNPGGF